MRAFVPVAACGLLAAAWAWSCAAPVMAGTLRVYPVLIEIDGARRTATISVENQEDLPVVIRAYPLAWSQEEGEDVYAETADLIVSPPVFTIPAGGTQLVRVGLRGPSTEPRAYRLIVEEVPEAGSAGGIRVALRLNLPLYSRMAAGDPAGLLWSARPDRDGALTIEARNPGAGYVRLDPEAAREATGLHFDDSAVFGTVLPGASRRWRIGPEPAIVDETRFRLIQEGPTDAAADQGSG